jgi:hypothetical protein
LNDEVDAVPQKDSSGYGLSLSIRFLLQTSIQISNTQQIQNWPAVGGVRFKRRPQQVVLCFAIQL